MSTARRAVVAAAVGLVVVGATMAIAYGATPDDVLSQIAALDAKYRNVPRPSDPEGVLQRSQAYEREFSQIGPEARNGMPIELSPDEYRPNVPPPGIHPAPEALPGYRPINEWVGEVDGMPVIVISVVPVADPGQGGVIVFGTDGAPSPFVAAPRAVGALAITAAQDLKLTLAGPPGDSFVFDVLTHAFV
jgi:hypothetical protein